MNFVTRVPVEANGHGGDDPDEMLFAFFRAEMPHPWPRPVPPEQAAPARRPWFLGSRLALAASVALLIAGYAVLSGALTPPATPDLTPIEQQNPSAKGIKELPPAEDGVGMNIEGLEQVGNNPTTIHIKVFEKK